MACLDLPKRIGHDEAVADDGRARLAAKMEDRRLALGRTWAQVADQGSTTTETLRQIRAGGTPMRALTKRAVEMGLHWASGSVDAILSGGEPIEISGQADSHPQTTIDAETRLREIASDTRIPPELRAWAESQLQQLTDLLRAAEKYHQRHNAG